MRILLVHSFYGSSAPSGENRVVIEECNLLRAAGHEVLECFETSDTVRDHGILPLIHCAVNVPWNRGARLRVRKLIREYDPDVMHVHNVFPMFSPSIFSSADGTRTGVVNTLHNYRTVCPSAIAARQGGACTECVDSASALPSLRHGCYRNSRIATVPLALTVSLHRRLDTYQSYVDAFVTLTSFQKSLLTRGGLPKDRIYVKPNSCTSSVSPLPWSQREDKVVFVGRVSKEKGVDVLLRAWEQWSSAPPLEILGDGPELSRLEALVSGRNKKNVTFVGQRSIEECRRVISKAKLLIIPSVWFEGLPLVVLEAFASGVPVVASDVPTFREVIEAPQAGRLFPLGDSAGLRSIVSSLWNEQDELAAMSERGISEYRRKYTPAQNMRALEEIYRTAISNRSLTRQRVYEGQSEASQG